MGRELRRVPAGWEHPTQSCPHLGGRCNPCYVSLFDESFAEALADWQSRLNVWVTGDDPDQQEYGYPKTATGFAEWAGDPPRVSDYRPQWSEDERTHYQVYETVTEGTPVSPVFATKDEVIDWWVNVGDDFNGRLTYDQAERWVNAGSSPSMISGLGGGVEPGVAIFKEALLEGTE